MRLRGLALALTLSACTTGQTNTTPPVSSGGGPGNGNVALQLSVGTINFNGVGVGLNVFETFRGANGFSAIPITTATLSGPAGFEGPRGSKDPGAGARTIPLGSHSDSFSVGAGVPATTLAGADGFGIGPPGCGCAGINFYPFQPQFVDVTQPLSGPPQPYYGGPPAYPPTVLAASALSALVSIPSSWAEGFYFVSLLRPAPPGTYTLTVKYAQNGVTTVKRVSAALRHIVLPSFSGTLISTDHKGGVAVHVNFPHGVKQVLVNVIDSNVPPSPAATCTKGLGFATLRFDKSGTQRVSDDLGNYGQGGARTFCKGDLLEAQIIGFDYDDFDLGPPVNAQQRPSLPPHADVTYTTIVVNE